MREIKFRLWMPNTGFDALPRMYHEVLAGGFSETVPRAWEGAQGWVNAWADNQDPDGVLMQYTGLKDKNGVEIYEGDIVHWPNQGEYSFNATVRYDRHCYYLDCFQTNDGASFEDFESERELEVIGNIYENPELLEQSSQDAPTRV